MGTPSPPGAWHGKKGGWIGSHLPPPPLQKAYEGFYLPAFETLKKEPGCDFTIAAESNFNPLTEERLGLHLDIPKMDSGLLQWDKSVAMVGVRGETRGRILVV